MNSLEKLLLFIEEKRFDIASIEEDISLRTLSFKEGANGRIKDLVIEFVKKLADEFEADQTDNGPFSSSFCYWLEESIEKTIEEYIRRETKKKEEECIS